MTDKTERTKLQRILACLHGEPDAEIHAELQRPDSEASRIVAGMRDQVALDFDFDWSLFEDGERLKKLVIEFQGEGIGTRRKPEVGAQREHVGTRSPTLASHNRNDRARWIRPLAIAACILLVTAAVASGSAMYWFISEARAENEKTRDALDRIEKLAEAKERHRFDSFDTDWLDPKKWRTGRPKTTAVDGYARLNDRGSLVTVAEFNEPIEVSLDWRWIDIAGDIPYRDTLTIALHTTGEHANKHPYRVTDGIEVTFQSHAGAITLASPTDPDFNPSTKESAFPMPAGKWHHIRIVDDGKTISVFFSGPSIPPETKERPVLKAEYKGDFVHHHIAVYNRELVGGALHESHVDNFAVRALR